MKVLAIALLCAVAAVQGRSAGVESNRAAEPAPGDVPYNVHLRVAIGTSGILQSGIGCLLSNIYILTARSNVEDSRFIWIRLDAVKVINPGLVIESNDVTRYPGNFNVAILNAGRNVEPTPNIAPVPLFGGGIIHQYEFFCGYGQDESGNAGERLSCYEVTLEKVEDLYCGSSTQAAIGKYDVGSPIVSERQQTALLVSTDGQGGGCFQPINEELVSWVEGVTGLDFSPPETEPEA